jgi:hypothetical protein
LELLADVNDAHHVPGENAVLSHDFSIVVAVGDEHLLGICVYDLVYHILTSRFDYSLVFILM